jgi:hypothetical protein
MRGKAKGDQAALQVSGCGLAQPAAAASGATIGSALMPSGTGTVRGTLAAGKHDAFSFVTWLNICCPLQYCCQPRPGGRSWVTENFCVTE